MTRRAGAGKVQDDSDAAREACRRNIERLIDETVAQSFPASDPPAWGVIGAMLEQQEDHPDRTAESGG